MAVRDDFAPGEVLAAADLNDTFASRVPFAFGTATPTTTTTGFLWYDSNFTPPVGKVWNGSAFVNFSQAPADFSNAATGSYTDGVAYKYLTFTASGTLTVTRAGLAEVLVVGGGGGGHRTDSSDRSCRSGGGGGGYYAATVELAVQSYTVTVGGGGSANSNGSSSSIGTLAVIGGGGRGTSNAAGSNQSTAGFGGGGSMGGYSIRTVFGGFIDADGGGAGGVVFGSNDRDGRASSITGSSVTRATGGVASSGSAGGANTGDGGGGDTGSAGGSGVVIIRVKV
jgi:hypothetical protein